MKSWQKKERKDEEDFKGRRTPASGGKSGFKGDVKADDWLVECKHTTKKSFSITKDLWEKVYSEALLADRKPALSIEFSDGKEIVTISKDDFMELTGMV